MRSGWAPRGTCCPAGPRRCMCSHVLQTLPSAGCLAQPYRCASFHDYWQCTMLCYKLTGIFIPACTHQDIVLLSCEGTGGLLLQRQHLPTCCLPLQQILLLPICVSSICHELGPGHKPAIRYYKDSVWHAGCDMRPASNSCAAHCGLLWQPQSFWWGGCYCAATWRPVPWHPLYRQGIHLCCFKAEASLHANILDGPQIFFLAEWEFLYLHHFHCGEIP